MFTLLISSHCHPNNWSRHFFSLALAALVCGSTCLTANAHGPQRQVALESGKIVTRQIVQDGPYNGSTEITRAYVMSVQEYQGGWYTRPNDIVGEMELPVYYSGPGLAFGKGQTFAADSILTEVFLPGFKRWESGAFVDAGATQLEGFRGAFNNPSAVSRTNDVLESLGLNVPVVYGTDAEEAHTSLRYRLIEEGINPNAVPADGVYLATLQLKSSDPGVQASDTFHYVLSKNATPESLRLAVASLKLPVEQVQVVPEPLGLGLIAGLLGLALTTRRNRS